MSSKKEIAVVHLRIPLELKDALRQAAKAKRKTMAAVVRELLLDWASEGAATAPDSSAP